MIIFNTGARRVYHANQYQPTQLSYTKSVVEAFLPDMDLLARSSDEIISYVWKHSVSGCLSLFSNHLFSLLCLRLPGISPTFTILSATKTCNNSNRRRKPNKYLSEQLAKTHNPTYSDKSFAKLSGQIVMIVCIGLYFVIPIISPVCYNGIPSQLNTFVKKGSTNRTNTFKALALQIPHLQLCGI